MYLVAILFGLVILCIFACILNSILDIMLPKLLGPGSPWVLIIKGIIGLAILCVIAGYFGYGGAWLAWPGR
jgi:hypothetical protein